MTDFQDEKKSAAENGSAQQFTSLTNTNGDRIMKKDAAKTVTRKPLKRDTASLKPYLSTGYDLMAVAGKSPARKNWRDREPLSADEAFQCFEDRNNVGVRLNSSDLVVDVDPRNFPKNDDVFARLQTEFALPLDAVVQTGNGGLHVYLKKPSELKISKKLSEFPGIDFLSDGHMVVGAGSIHPKSGDLYRWKSDELWFVEQAPEKLLAALTITGRGSPISEAGEVSCEQLEEMLSALDVCDFKDQTEWLNLMMACHHATGGLGRSEFVTWSVSDPKYSGDSEIIERRWNSLNNNKQGLRTAASLYRELLKAGRGDLVPRSSAVDDFKDDLLLTSLDLDCYESGKAKPTFRNACEILRHDRLKPGFNELSQRAYFLGDDLPWPENSGSEVNDDTLRLTRGYLIAQYGIQFSKDDISEAVQSVALENPFDPLVEYLDSLVWDAVPRIDSLLTRYFGADDSEYVRVVGRLLLIALVRRARKPGCKFDQLVCLKGKQGAGKSTALNILGGEFFSDAALGSLSDKDTVIAIQGKWLFEWGEGVSLNRTRSDEMKSFLSRQVDECRLPYARHSKSMPRRTIFVATTNDGLYLNDMTGLRRFLPVEVGEIDFNGLKNDRDQLLAEASEAEAKGEAIVLPEQLWSEAAERQNDVLAVDPWVDDVRAYLNTLDESVTRISSSELLASAIGVPGGRKAQKDQKRLAAVMSRIGWEYSRSVRIDGQAPQTGYISPRDELFQA